jgi:hypothetical protein
MKKLLFIAILLLCGSCTEAIVLTIKSPTHGFNGETQYYVADISSYGGELCTFNLETKSPISPFVETKLRVVDSCDAYIIGDKVTFNLKKN